MVLFENKFTVYPSIIEFYTSHYTTNYSYSLPVIPANYKVFKLMGSF